MLATNELPDQTSTDMALQAPRLSTMAELMKRTFPPPRWIVPNVLPEGLSILAGPPKVGKTWLTLSISLAVVYGGRALGKIEVEPGEVLYLALEDNERRLQNRIKKLAGDRTDCLERFHYIMDWPAIDKGGIDQLRSCLSAYRNVRLIVIDTLAPIKPKPTKQANSNLYDADYAIGRGLLKTAADFTLALHKKGLQAGCLSASSNCVSSFSTAALAAIDNTNLPCGRMSRPAR